MEIYKREKGEPSEHLAARLIQQRARGRCEFEWYKDQQKFRCRELHKEPALGFKGIVQLHLMPVGALGDGRIANLRCLCQKHAYEILERACVAIGAGKKPVKHNNENQTTLL